ncbi:MAG: carboxypeptidase-like regulatory domain-containing protein [Bacteroidota bacterium]|nr:carboxypeptidase-like regulatory domain-containing protein [Bacteroidota bacterium]
MHACNGNIAKYIQAIALLIFLVPSNGIKCQEGILDSALTFRAGNIKTGNALNLITKQTGYHFTYDSRLVDQERKTEMNFRYIKLRVILDSILNDKSLAYSVIDQFIIISREIPPKPVSVADSSTLTGLTNISGIIVDAETSDPLPFATIALKHQGKGTVSNGGGEFSIKISPDSYSDTIQVSYLGFYGREIPIRQSLGNNFRIVMKREFISIPEIIIRREIPQEIIRKALSSVPRNYGNSPAGMTAFYREGVMKRNELQTYSEAILNIYKSSYTSTFLNDQIKVFKSRKIENSNITDSLTVRLKAGLSTCLELDGIKNGFDFLSGEDAIDYSYRLTDIVSFDEESAFEIEFGKKEGDPETPMFRGSVFINTTDYAVLNADFEIYPEYLKKTKETFISKTTKGFITWPVSVKYSVSYRKIGDRYYLNHVRGDLLFSAKQKRKLFNTQFNVFFEMAVTSVTLKDVTRFEREELAPIHSVFSKTITSYDPEFWGKQDFLKPEDNLLQALKNMHVKLQEFSE